ncbi:MAG: hypothetical protein GY699_22145 [Desulfobacteraceae bacterium]|nr:hypothetical protein [Desulfobacteraceae bacterium]
MANKLVDVLDSKFFKSLSEPVRIQIIRYLLIHGRADRDARSVGPAGTCPPLAKMGLTN